MELIVIKVGSDANAATEEDVNHIRESLNEVLSEARQQNKPAIWVTHHNVQIEIHRCASDVGVTNG